MKHSLTPPKPPTSFHWTLDLDSDGDPVLKLNGRIVLSPADSLEGNKLILFAQTVQELGLGETIISSNGPHYDE